MMQRKLKEFQEKCLSVNKDFYCDMFDRLDLMSEDILNRTLWVDAKGVTEEALKDWFENKKKCGKVLNIRQRGGQQYPNKEKDFKFTFVEFASMDSVMKALLIGKKSSKVNGVGVKMHRAGTGTFFYTKSILEKNSKTNYTALNTTNKVSARNKARN